MDKLEDILNELRHIISISRKAYDEKDTFNLFRVLNVQCVELKHSAFLAELLNPKGSHHQGKCFLESFIRQFTPDFKVDDTTKVWVERSTKYGRIDIMIETSTNPRQAIIIENKIYAGDQNAQLKRYHNYAKSTFGENNFSILYLTLYGNEASQQSCDGVPYKRISYKNDIRNWINDCCNQSSNFPNLCISLKQYNEIIDELTNMNEELIHAMVKHADTIAEILDNQWNYKAYVLNEIIKRLLIEVADELYLDTNIKSKELKDNVECDFQKEDWDKYSIFLGKDRNAYFLGIHRFQSEGLNEPIEHLDCFSENSEKDWPYGWKWIDDKYVNLMYNKTLANIIQEPEAFKEYLKRELMNILEKVKEKDIKL